MAPSFFLSFFFLTHFPAMHVFENSDNVMDSGTCSATCNDFLQIKMSVLQLKQKVRVERTVRKLKKRSYLTNINCCIRWYFIFLTWDLKTIMGFVEFTQLTCNSNPNPATWQFFWLPQALNLLTWGPLIEPNKYLQNCSVASTPHLRYRALSPRSP